jgi:hypothetical protein
MNGLCLCLFVRTILRYFINTYVKICSFLFFSKLLRWIHITLTWRATTSRQIPSVEWDCVSYRLSAHTVLTWRGNASRFDEVWSGLIEVWSVCKTVVVSSLFVQLWTRNGCLVMCMHLKYLFVHFQLECVHWSDVTWESVGWSLMTRQIQIKNPRFSSDVWKRVKRVECS